MKSFQQVTRRELESLRRMAVQVAGEAAAYLRDRFGLDELLSVVSVHEGDEGMRIDVEGEKNIMELLKAEGFSGLFLGEEHGLVKLGDEPLVAVVDPLDGSKNYASLVPWSAVSISIAAIPQAGTPTLRDVLVGAVAPIFPWPVASFARGLGAYEGGARIAPADGSQASRLVMAYVENLDQARAVHAYLRASNGRKSVRALGSASLEIVWTGFGRAEAFIDVRGRLRVVDVAAALWIAKEAGATVLVERPAAQLTRVERVGSVVVAAPSEHARLSVARALKEAGFGSLLDSKL